MWPRRRHTPMQLAGFAICGAALYIVAVFTAALLSAPALRNITGHWFAASWLTHLGFHRGLLFRILFGLVFILPGLIMELQAVHLLGQGVRLEWWSEEQVEALRRQADRLLSTAVSWIGCCALLCSCALAPSHSILFPVAAQFWFPVMVISSLRTATRKPISRERRRIDRSMAKPLESEHWGVRGASVSD